MFLSFFPTLIFSSPPWPPNTSLSILFIYYYLVIRGCDRGKFYFYYSIVRGCGLGEFYLCHSVVKLNVTWWSIFTVQHLNTTLSSQRTAVRFTKPRSTTMPMNVHACMGIRDLTERWRLRGQYQDEGNDVSPRQLWLLCIWQPERTLRPQSS